MRFTIYTHIVDRVKGIIGCEMNYIHPTVSKSRLGLEYLPLGNYLGDTYAYNLGSGGGSVAEPVSYLISSLDSLIQCAFPDNSFDLRYIFSDKHATAPPPASGSDIFTVTSVLVQVNVEQSWSTQC